MHSENVKRSRTLRKQGGGTKSLEYFGSHPCTLKVRLLEQKEESQILRTKTFQEC